MPMPRKDRPASAVIRPGRASDVATTIGRHQVGQQLLEQDAPGRHAHDLGGLDELALAQRQHLAADQPGQAHPAEDREDGDQGEELRPCRARRAVPACWKCSTMIGAMASAPSRNGKDRNRSVTNMMIRSSQPREKPGDQTEDDADEDAAAPWRWWRSAGRCAGRRGAARGCRPRSCGARPSGWAAQKPWFGRPVDRHAGRAAEVEHVDWPGRASSRSSGRCSAPCRSTARTRRPGPGARR